MNNKKTPMAKENMEEAKQAQAQAESNGTVATIGDRSADANAGSEYLDPLKDLKIPILCIVNALSPERDKNDPKFISGAEEGDIFNNVTRKLYKVNGPTGEVEQLLIAPITHIRVHNEWRKRSLKGGYIRTYPDGKQPDTIDGLDGQKKVKVIPNVPDHVLVETVMHDVLVFDPDGFYESMISMSGSNLGPSRDFTSKLNARKVKKADGTQYTPAYFDNLVALSTVIKEFTEGKCYVFKTEIVGRTSDIQYTDARGKHVDAHERLMLMAPAAAQLLENGAAASPSPDNKY